MKHLIRAICVLLLQAMLLSFTACGSNAPDGAESRKGASSETGETDTESADTTPENEYPAAPARGKDEQINWYSADLAETMRLAAGYVEGMLDADKDYEPYFYISAAGYGQPAVALHALEIGIPHVTGRAIDCLFNVERATGRKIDSFAENTYTEYYYSCMDEIGLPVWYDETGSRKGMTPHNLRESCEAMAWLIRSRNDPAAWDVADRFLSVLETLMPDHCGYIKNSAIVKAGLSQWFSGDLNSPGDTGRLVGALLNLYDATKDERALTLAGDIAKNATRWFNPITGSIANAGTHIHSITSTLSGLLEYAYMTDDQDLVELVRAVYEGDTGLPLVMSSTGWIKEQINVANEIQGEVNQIGDVIEVQLLFAKNELSERADWYGKAESFMRSALLPSQVLDNSFLTFSKDPNAEDAYARIDERVIGGFGFPVPSAHLQGRSSPVNTIDITQGAVQAISYFTDHIAYCEDGVLWVNLLFDWENDVAKVESRLPLLGKVQVTPKQNGAVRIRVWEGITANKVRVYVNGETADYSLKGGYVLLNGIHAGDKIYLDFDIGSTNYTETFYRGTPQECEYHIYKYGEQVVAVTPVKGVYPLYKGWPLTIDGLDSVESVSAELNDAMKAQGYLAFVPLDIFDVNVDVRGTSNEYVTDATRGKCLSYDQSNKDSTSHGILLDMYFEPVVLDPSTDYLAFWLFVDDPAGTSPLIVEYASAAIHAGEEMFQGCIDLPFYGANGTLRSGWNPIVMPLNLSKMAYNVQVTANNSPKYDHIFRIRFMNTQNGSGRAVNYRIDNVAFVRGSALEDYRFDDGTTALRNVSQAGATGA